MKNNKQTPERGPQNQPSRNPDSTRDNEKKQDAKKEGYQKETGEQGKGLKTSDLPDATNESIGAMGSGQRQDSN